MMAYCMKFYANQVFSKIKSDGTCSRSCEKLTEYYDVYIATAAMDVPTSFHDKYEWLRVFSI